MTELIILGVIVLVGYLLTKKTEKNGFVYAKHQLAHKNVYSSFANPIEIKSGYKWATLKELKKIFTKSEKNTVFIDEFRFDENYVEDCGLSRGAVKKAHGVQFHFTPLNLTQSLLLTGKMGAGKSEFYFSILSQKFYSRAVIHQVKAGDFVEKYFRKRHDILFSPFDTRGTLWNVMNEDEGIIKTFFENYANAIMGDKKDFFTAASNRIYNELSNKIRTKYKDETNDKKWLLFIKAIKDLFEEMESGTQNSMKDIKGTMEAILEPLEVMAFQMQDPNQKTFVIKDFLKKKHQCKLFLDNIPEHEKSLTPLFSAFTACLSQVMTSMPDSKTDFTLLALDEFLSFAKVMDEASMKRLFTLIRSKGGIMMPAIQYVPKDDKKLQQLLTSSAFAWIYFSVIEEETVNLLKNTIGETHYTYEEESHSVDSKHKKNKSYSTKNEKYHTINNELLNGLGSKFEHICYIPNHKILYKGYTPQVDLKVIAEKTCPIDLSKFYAMKYIDEDEKTEDLKNLTFADLFKKKVSKLQEYKLWKQFENAKKLGKNEIQNFKKENNLEEANLEFLFKKYMVDKQVVDNKMKILSLEERKQLKENWDNLEGDRELELEFIEEHELFAALPNLFMFNNESEIKQEEDEW